MDIVFGLLPTSSAGKEKLILFEFCHCGRQILVSLNVCSLTYVQAEAVG